jgi:hypothetical protein
MGLEARVAQLEAQVARLLAKLEATEKSARNDSPSPQPWWRKIAGTFEGDPYFAEAMRLGREYRESLRPKPRKRKKK